MNRSTSIAYIDLLTCLFCFFLVAFAIVYDQNRQQNIPIGNIEYKAEFLITMDWPDASSNDFDLWVKGPKSRIIFYKDPNSDEISLDRDDQGMGGTSYPTRREIISIRGKDPGDYVVNVVLWAKRRPTPETVRVVVLKLNPYSEIIEKSLVLTEEKQEQTVVSFTVDDTNRVLDKSESQISLMREVIIGGGGG